MIRCPILIFDTQRTRPCNCNATVEVLRPNGHTIAMCDQHAEEECTGDAREIGRLTA